jgi:hypothetical protein
MFIYGTTGCMYRLVRKEDIWEALMVGELLHPAKPFFFFFFLSFFLSVHQLPSCIGGLLHLAKLRFTKK